LNCKKLKKPCGPNLGPIEKTQKSSKNKWLPGCVPLSYAGKQNLSHLFLGLWETMGVKIKKV